MNYKILSNKNDKLTEKQRSYLLYATSLNEEQLRALKSLFIKNSRSEKIKKIEFIDLVKRELNTKNKSIDESLLENAFSLIDVSNKGFLSYEKFVLALYYMLLKDSKQKSNFLLKAFKLNIDDKIYRSDLIDLLGYGLKLENSEEIATDIIGYYGLVEDSKKQSLFFPKNFKRIEYLKLGELLEVFSTDSRVKNLVIDAKISKKHKFRIIHLFKLKPLKSPKL